MHKKWISLLVSLTVILTPLGTSKVMAQPSELTYLFPALVGIRLTQEQQNQLFGLSNQVLPQIQSVLTLTQLQSFNIALNQGQGIRVALSSLKDLSVSQKLRLRTILESSRTKVNQILTFSQQQQLRNNLRTSLNQLP